jgi:MFS family permease
MFPTRVSAAAAAGFVGLLSLFNMAGRFVWSSLSDRFGRRPTYFAFFTLGPLLYLAIPFAGKLANIPLFVGSCALILTMYGGGFATIPAYLADLFGTQNVGAIHGRLLTAWSAAGVAGPVLVNWIRQAQLDAGLTGTDVYGLSMRLMVGLLLAGFVSNLLVRPVATKYFQPATEGGVASIGTAGGGTGGPRSGRTGLWIVVSWLAVSLPLGWGVFMTFQKALQLFR